MIEPKPTTFSFGENWQKYLDTIPPRAARNMTAYVADWIGSDLNGQRIADVGSGQGLTSLVAYQAGASVTSIDIDPASVAATRRLWEQAARPSSWAVERGSILDAPFIESLGDFDTVISWGVLHHTGDVWTALDAVAGMVRPGGHLWIALYHRTYRSGRSLRTKRMYNRTPRRLRPLVRAAFASVHLTKSALRRDLGRIRAYDAERGMSWRRDIEDWLGGLPYEPVGPGEVIGRLRPRGFVLERLNDALGEGANDVYLFRYQPPGSLQ